MYLIHFCLTFRSTQKRGESFGISRIGSKIKGVFKSTTMEGAMLPNYGLTEGEDDFVSKILQFDVCINSDLQCHKKLDMLPFCFPFPLFYLFQISFLSFIFSLLYRFIVLI